MISISLIWTIVFAPESPLFLYECDRFDDLKLAFAKIQKFNGNYDPEVIESVVTKLKEQKEKD